MNGYAYRVYPLDAAQLRTLVNDLVGASAWTFGGAALWDVDPLRGRANLRELKQISTLAELDVSGDFGHVFTASVEVRWKRRTATTYDALALSETPLAIAGAQTLAHGWAVSVPPAQAIIQSGERGAITFIAYHAPNGAVQFLRYTGVQE